MRVLLLVLLMAGMEFVYGQNDVDYKHKTLIKALEKAGVSDINQIEEMSISDSLLNGLDINGKYFRIREENENQLSFVYVGRVNSCRSGGCSVSRPFESSVESEYFDYYILFGEDKTVKYVKVFNYQATHGYEITAKSWLRQFEGFDGTGRLTVNKNVDAISGATISVYAITADIETKTGILKQL